ncbi:rhomboid family intramembrane serine protease [Fluviibacterium sp. DFM31]|uniref:Rhomboid family intramembrane serine protease n=1 Tax=Meridianimarinicoccus marinus TaxID=3231483 RepID=A0ABV3L2U6_9RHOB
MIPIRDHNPATRTAYFTYGLLALNVVIFLAYVPMFSDPRRLTGFFLTYGIIPAQIEAGGAYGTLLTSMFLHGGWMHLLGNMLFLHIFGDNLEDRLGHLRFGLFYLACGLGAGMIQVLADPGSTVPVVGASGAIAGLMGGYLLMFPRARIDIFVFLIVLVRIIPVPAWAMLGLWFGLQVFNGLGTPSDVGGVAYWAHAGGFVLGMVLMVPSWIRAGGPAFWARTNGHPDNPEARYRFARSPVPRVRRRRAPPEISRVPRVPKRKG